MNIFDTLIGQPEAHAIKPSSYDAIASGVRTSIGLTDGTIDVIVNDVCKKLADDLQGEDRLKALGREGIQVVTINTFSHRYPQMMLKIVEDLNTWMSTKSAENPQLIGIASIPSPPFLPDGRYCANPPRAAASGPQHIDGSCREKFRAGDDASGRTGRHAAVSCRYRS